jgi:ABC-type Mn2+/Zn2+ transport system permease subunit
LDIQSLLFAGLEPNQLFGKVFSVDMSELLLVFGTIAITIGILVVFGNWWQR